ncbi:MAG: methionyl-tRNA formyltransferase [Chloroflexi bacterium]|nr:methionyl-tRNA formyltransferase [Chloroflexota bacterium]
MTTNEFSTHRVVFMGTPDFAVPSLQNLINAPNFDVVGVVTQPDRPAGRGQKVQMSPVKETALAAGIPIIQPEKTHLSPDFDQIAAWQPDFLVVVAFGQILRQKVLDLPKIAPVNVHASLLPRWRGAAPIQAAIRSGDTYTGVTTMVMDKGMDTGPILLQDSIPLSPGETGQSLHDKLAALGAILLIHTLEWFGAGSIQPRPQPTSDHLVIYAPTLKKEDGVLAWSSSAADIDRHVRAFTPWPGTYTCWGEKRLKILAGFPLETDLNLAPGVVMDTRDIPLDQPSLFVIGTGEGVYAPTQLQIEGRSAVDAAAFLNGAPGFMGSTLG